MFFQTWKQRAAVPRSAFDGCFNGATFFQTWKPRGRLVAFFRLLLLQWSHVLSNVETLLVQIKSGASFLASMEPRSFKRGNRVRQRRVCARQPCFNGATFFQTWKLDLE